MRKDWSSFSGMIPRMRPHLLGTANATRASNTKLWSGAAEPFRAPKVIQSLRSKNKSGVTVDDPLKTIFRHQLNLDSDTQYWWTFVDDVDLVRGNVDDDQESTYFTGTETLVQSSFRRKERVSRVSDGDTGGGPYPAGGLLVGIPPQNLPPFILSATGGDPTAPQIVVVFAASYVTSTGARGALSAASNSATVREGDTVTLEDLGDATAGAFPWDRGITHIDVWASLTDETGITQFYFWQRVAIASPGTSQTLTAVFNSADLGEAPDSPQPSEPPENGFGLMSHPAGFHVQFTRRRVHRSETYKPYSYPVEYADDVMSDIVGGVILGNSIVVLTKTHPIIFTGNDPESMNKVELEGHKQACLAKRTIRKFTGGVLYAGPDGVSLITPSGSAAIVSEAVFERKQWQAYKPESMHAAIYEDRYIVFYDTGTTRGSLIFEFDGNTVTAFVESTVWASATYTDERRDELFLCIPDATSGTLASGNNKLCKWDAGDTFLTMVWRSREERPDSPQNVGAAQVRADAYPLTFRMLGTSDAGSHTYSYTVTNGKPFPLPGGIRYRTWKWEVEGTAAVSEVRVASTILDLASG